MVPTELPRNHFRRQKHRLASGPQSSNNSLHQLEFRCRSGHHRLGLLSGQRWPIQPSSYAWALHGRSGFLDQRFHDRARTVGGRHFGGLRRQLAAPGPSCRHDLPCRRYQCRSRLVSGSFTYSPTRLYRHDAGGGETQVHIPRAYRYWHVALRRRTRRRLYVKPIDPSLY